MRRLYYRPLIEKKELSDGKAEDDDFVDAAYDQDSPIQDGKTTIADDNDPGNEVNELSPGNTSEQNILTSVATSTETESDLDGQSSSATTSLKMTTPSKIPAMKSSLLFISK